MLIIILTTSTVSMEKGLDVGKSSSNTQMLGETEEIKTMKTNSKSYILFDLVTDYTTVALFLVKIYHAILFGISLFGQSRPDEDLLMVDGGEQKQKVRSLSHQRKALQNYYMYSITFQWFTSVQCISVIWIFINSLKVTCKIVFLLAFSAVNKFYILEKMNQLLEQMNLEIKKNYLAFNDKKN